MKLNCEKGLSFKVSKSLHTFIKVSLLFIIEFLSSVRDFLFDNDLNQNIVTSHSELNYFVSENAKKKEKK